VKQWQRKKIEELTSEVQGLIQAKKLKVPKDFAVFCELWLGLKLTTYQVEAAELIEKNYSTALRWSRQSGKSHLVAAWLLHFALAHDNAQIAIVGPSWRQTKIVIRKINGFLSKIPRGLYRKRQATMVSLRNGSLIQAFPCSPETIRGFTLNVVYADELNYISNDEEMFDAISFTLATTGGKFVCSSTPGSTDSLFWRIFNRPQFTHFAKSHITWEQAVEPNGPLKRWWLENKRREYEGDEYRWRREMMAEWAEDEAVWLPLALITKCQDANLDLWDDEGPIRSGRFFGGLDFGKERDHSAFIVIEQVDKRYLLRHVKVWPLETKYASVIGYVKTVADRWHSFEKIRADITGVGNYIIEDMKNGDIENVEGVSFTHPRKQEMASLLKQRMLNGEFVYPYVDISVSPTKKTNFSVELNVERFELRKDGTYSFHHPQNQHDDVFWSTALSLYATVEMTADPMLLEAFKFG
jgi:hypothetical protein